VTVDETLTMNFNQDTGKIEVVYKLEGLHCLHCGLDMLNRIVHALNAMPGRPGGVRLREVSINEVMADMPSTVKH